MMFRKGALAFCFLGYLGVPAVKADDSERFAYSGFLAEEVGYSYQHEEFTWSKVKSTASLNVDAYFSPSWSGRLNVQGTYDAAYKFYGRSHFNEETLDVYEEDFRINEAYTDVDINSWLNVRFGRQFFGWGESNSEQISDLGNPRDLRELGLQNVKDIRLPVGATKFTVYSASWEYNLIAVHEARVDELGAEGSEFDPFLAFRERLLILSADEPESDLDNTGVLSRLFISNDWGDISFFAARQFEGFPLLLFKGVNADTQQLIFQPEYNQLNSYGFFGNLIDGSWQLKYDFARTLDMPHDVKVVEYLVPQLQTLPVSSVISFQEKNIVKGMFGIEYSGFTDTQVSLEYIASYIEDHTEMLREEKYERKISTYISRTFSNGNITSSLWMNHLISDNANIFRIDVSYNYDDDVKFFIALSGIEGARKGAYYYDYDEVDRFAVGVKVSF